ncbi:MAG: hypothetical protein V1928_02090 [Parcubacteria group bacterium]
MEPFYRIIFKRSLALSWKHKWLWILGFFAAFIGNGSVYEALLRSFNNFSDGQSLFATIKEYSQTGVLGLASWSNLSSMWAKDASGIILPIMALLLFLCVLALVISLGVISQAGLIRSLVELDKSKSVRTSLKSSWQIGVERFWPVLEINVITKVVFFGILFLLAFIFSLFAGQNWIVYGIAMLIFVIIGIIIYFLTIYGTAFAVLRNKNAFHSLMLAWHLFRRNVVLNLEMGLLLFGMNILVLLAAFAVLFIVLSPLFLIYLMFMFSSVALGVTIMTGIMAAIAIVVMVLLGSWWSAFQLGAWAILFEDLVMKGGVSKITRILRQVFRK